MANKDKKLSEGEQKQINTSDNVQIGDLELDIEELTKSVEAKIDELFRPESDIVFEVDRERSEQSEITIVNDIIESESVVTQPSEIAFTDSYPKEESKEEPTLQELLERATVSYLSLDWEFSQENIQSMNDVLVAIEAKIDRVEETRILLEILKRLLNWFSNYEQTVSSVSLGLFREVLQFLNKVLQKKQEIGEKERNIVEQFRKRFNILIKQYGIKEPDLKFTPIVRKDEALPHAPKVVEAEISIPEPAFEKEVPYDIGYISSFDDFENEIKNLLINIEKTNERLKKVVGILNSRPNLKPVGDRLIKLVEQYENYARRINFLGTFISEHKASILGMTTVGIAESLQQKEALPEELGVKMKPEQDLLSSSQEQVLVHKKDVETETKIQIPVVEHVAGSEEPSKVQKIDEVYLFLCEGRYFAIPSNQLVKYDNISSKKASKLRSKGYGTLKDVKPFFKSIKHGVKDAWRNKSDRELKSMNFNYVDIKEKFGFIRGKEEYGGVAVFASDGVDNVIFVVDFVIEDRSFPVTHIKPARTPNLLGTTSLDRYKNVEIIDIKALL